MKGFNIQNSAQALLGWFLTVLGACNSLNPSGPPGQVTRGRLLGEELERKLISFRPDKKGWEEIINFVELALNEVEAAKEGSFGVQYSFAVQALPGGLHGSAAWWGQATPGRRLLVAFWGNNEAVLFFDTATGKPSSFLGLPDEESVLVPTSDPATV